MVEFRLPVGKYGTRIRLPMSVIGGAVIVLAAIWYLAYGMQGVVSVSVTTRMNVTNSTTVFAMGHDTYMIYLNGVDPTGKAAYVSISKLPVFINPLLNVTLNAGSSTKVNVGTTLANMQIRLVSIGAKAITVDVTPLDPSLQLSPDTQYIKQSQSYIGVGGQKNTAQSTTTISQSSVTTTAGSTTTTVQVNTTYNNIIATLKTSQYYSLMANYSILYANTTNCTPQKYNSTYTKVHGSAPNGVNSYWNVSRFVPFALYYNITAIANGNYSVVYKTKTVDSLFNNRAALTININPAVRGIISTTLSGAYQGSNYSNLVKGYQRAALIIGGACGVDIP